MRRNDGLPGYHPLSGRSREAQREAEVQQRVADAKARAQAGAAPPVPAAPGEPVLRPAALKGAVKVEGFPSQTKYPFREIADDGGVWKIDPSAFGAKAPSVRTAVSKWATGRGLKAKTAIEDGVIYVQFSKAAP